LNNSGKESIELSSDLTEHNMKREELVIALVGQPNCGKSTLFTAVSGYYVESGNFPGTTVGFTETKIDYKGSSIKLIDLPGIYSINSFDMAERVTRDKILSRDVDIILNVIDATMLARSMELTLQLIEMQRPIVVVLNMMDEAIKKGMKIDLQKFEELTGIKAFPVVAINGEGISELFDYITVFDSKRQNLKLPEYDRDVEECIAEIEKRFPERILKKHPEINRRFWIIRVLEMDEYFEGLIREEAPDFTNFIIEKRRELATIHNWPEEGVFASHRHAVVLDMFEKIVKVERRERKDLIEELDRFFINPIGGFISIFLIFGFIFFLTFYFGDFLSGLLIDPLDNLKSSLTVNKDGLLYVILSGLFDGIIGGLGVVLPYLIPLLLLMALLEDMGVLPRMAFMLDGILHNFGLHGNSIIPFLLGYGCNVPAIMSARSMPSERDRISVMLLSTFIPCSARTVVILAIVTKYLGWAATLGLYAMNLLVIILLSFGISRYRKKDAFGFIMEVPSLRIPRISILIKKVWFRASEFFLFAWPVIIGSSIVLALLDYWKVSIIINKLFKPLTYYILGLPEELSITLFLGIFRKELSLLMLREALGVENISQVLSNSQMWVLTVFITFYIPCIATISSITKEGGYKVASISILLNLSVAILLSGIFRLILSL